MKLMTYQAKRGGRVVFQDIAKPSSMEWGTPLEAMEAALELEKTVSQPFGDLYFGSFLFYRSTRVFLISTRPLVAKEMLIYVTFWRQSILVNRWKELRSLET